MMGHSKCQSTGTGKKKKTEKRNSAATEEASVESQLNWGLLRTKSTDSAVVERGSFAHSQPEQMWEAGEHHHVWCIQGDP